MGIKLTAEQYARIKEAVVADWKETGDDSIKLESRHGIPNGTIRKWIIKAKKKVNTSITRFQTKASPSIAGYKKLVITSCTNDTGIETEFYAALKRYCVHHNAKLIVLPVYYKFTTASVFNCDAGDLVVDDIQVKGNLRIASKMRVLPTTVNPLSAKDGLSKGQTIIIPHPQVSMRVLPELVENPNVLMTTGSISRNVEIYPENATGQKAEFNHSLGAIVVELGEGDSFHYRQLNGDDNKGFYDIDGYWTCDEFKPGVRAAALYLGDAHVSVIDKDASAATFDGPNSIVETLNPELMFWGDALDCKSVSHHDQNNQLMKLAKHKLKKNSLKKEIESTIDFIRAKKRAGTKNLLVGSNHNDHLDQWLKTDYAPKDLENASIYHFLMYLIHEEMDLDTDDEIVIPGAFKLYVENTHNKDILEYTQFLGRRESFKVLGIECSLHGDVGFNGAKGSANSYSKMSSKVIHGHTHTPGITQGCYTVGTLSRKNLSYTRGPSSWMHTHCVIYPNGKRQLINIINGHWRI